MRNFPEKGGTSLRNRIKQRTYIRYYDLYFVKVNKG